MAAHERERKAKMKPPEGPRGRQTTARATKESNVPVSQRLREFKDNGLKEDAGKLYCAPCKEVIPNIKSSINDHVSRQKHKDALDSYSARDDNDGDIKEILTDYFKSNPDASGTRTSADTHLYRYRVVETFISSGTPMLRADKFRTLLERAGHPLTDSSNLTRTYVPRIEEREMDLLKSELSEQFIGIHFDGTTRLGEAINMTGRWCTADFFLMQRLLTFVTTQKHCDGRICSHHCSHTASVS